MNTELENDVTELDLEDDAYALEAKMRKLEKEAARLLNHSNALLQTLNKETSKQEEIKQEVSEVKDAGENIVSS